ncbi:MAG: hypothetical protein U9N11_07180 [Campylobacterota bacterium]|nr:hypothetical protein [Campylobacterota bacterium]
MLRTFLLTTLLFTSIFAKEVEEYPFIGVTISTQDISINSVENDNIDQTFGIRYGRQTQDWRTMFTYGRGDNFENFSLEVDRYIADGLFGKPEYRPYVGLTVGKLNYSNTGIVATEDINTTRTDDNNVTTTVVTTQTKDSDTSGYYYGANLGLTVYIADKVDADISYYYYQVEDFEFLNTMQGVTFALHYFY